MDLGGTWKFTTSPPAAFWTNNADPPTWPDVLVPGELTAQGISIATDVEYPYKRSLRILAEAAGERFLIRFAGVYSYTRVWVNGRFLRDHQGGFTSWDCDISDDITPGQAAWLTVGVMDRSDEISYASNYAKYYVAGILREVKLLILPWDHVSRFQVETVFDSSYTQAQLRANVAATFHGGQSAALRLHPENPHGDAVSLNANSGQLSVGRPEASVEIPVRSLAKWHAEHPNLYTLEADVFVDGTRTQKLVAISNGV